MGKPWIRGQRKKGGNTEGQKPDWVLRSEGSPKMIIQASEGAPEVSQMKRMGHITNPPPKLRQSKHKWRPPGSYFFWWEALCFSWLWRKTKLKCEGLYIQTPSQGPIGLNIFGASIAFFQAIGVSWSTNLKDGGWWTSSVGRPWWMWKAIALMLIWQHWPYKTSKKIVLTTWYLEKVAREISKFQTISLSILIAPPQPFCLQEIILISKFNNHFAIVSSLGIFYRPGWGGISGYQDGCPPHH